MAVQDPQTAALLAHVVSQVESNVQFLVSQNYISHSDASTFLSKLPNSASGTHANYSTPRAPAFPTAAPLPARRSPAVPPPPDSTVVQARALWAYNEHGQEVDDLSFSAGDIIVIVEETNADWWLGKVNGRQALFPSSYVEKIESGSAASARAVHNNKPVYKPFGGTYQAVDGPPAPGAGVNSVGLQQQDDSEKKSKYGGLKNTMAHSAAGGVGFGAGAAIGGGLVRAIF